MKHLYTRSPGIPRPPGSLHRTSLQDLFTRPLWEISIQELSTRSLDKTSMRDLYTRALYKISSQDLYEKSLQKSSLQDLFTRPLWEISIQELSTRSLQKTSMRYLYTRSPDIPGPPRSLHRSSLQDLFTRPLWEISIQDLLISLDLWDLLTTRSLQKTSARIQHAESTERVARTSSLQDLFTRPLWEISIQELSTRSLHKTSMRYLFTRSPDIPGPPRSLHRSSLQDLFTRPLWEISIQDLLISLDLWYLLTTRSLQKTSIRIQHAESTERVARTKSKSAPRYSESDPTRTNSAEGCTSRNKKCPRLSASDIPSAKWARRYSQSDPTRTKSRDGCICKHKIGTAPQRDSKNQSSDRTLTSELQYEMRFFDVLWRKYCACHEKMSPRHTKSCNCHAKWCRHSRSKFDDSFTKRAFRPLQDFKSTNYCACHEKCTFFTTSNFEQPLRRFCTPLKTLTFCTFPDFRKSTRRAGENAPPKWTSSRPRLAQAKCKFSISRELFPGKGCQKSRTRQRTPPIYTRCFSTTVRTP